MLFSENVKIVPVLPPLAAADTDRTSEVIDTKGFHRCIIVLYHGALAGAQTVKLVHADAATDENTLTSGQDVAGSAQSIAGTDDNGAKFIEFFPTRRFYQLSLDKTATQTSIEAAVAFLYEPAEAAVTQAGGTTTIGDGTGAVTGETLKHPVDGTA